MAYEINRVPYVPRIHTGTPWVTYIIIGICINIFGYMHWLAAVTNIEPTRLLYMGGISKNVLGYGIDSYVRFISAGFLHGGVGHLLMNMYALWTIGARCEWYYGKPWFLTLYVLSIIGASYFSAVLHSVPTWSVGASGGIMGLFAAELCISKYFNPHKSWFAQDTFSVLAMNLFLGALPFIDFWAHLGGAVVGACMGLMLTKVLWRTFSESTLNALSYILATFAVCAVLYTAVNMTGQYMDGLDHLHKVSNPF